jgi:hypothetical protein
VPLAEEGDERGIGGGIGLDVAQAVVQIPGAAEFDHGRAGGAQFTKKGGDGSRLGDGVGH